MTYHQFAYPKMIPRRVQMKHSCRENVSLDVSSQISPKMCSKVSKVFNIKNAAMLPGNCVYFFQPCWTNNSQFSTQSTPQSLEVQNLEAVSMAILKVSMVLWMKEILHHLGCIKPWKSWDIYHINWCRISSINSINMFLMVRSMIGTCEPQIRGEAMVRSASLRKRWHFLQWAHARDPWVSVFHLCLNGFQIGSPFWQGRRQKLKCAAIWQVTSRTPATSTVTTWTPGTAIARRKDE